MFMKPTLFDAQKMKEFLKLEGAPDQDQLQSLKHGSEVKLCCGWEYFYARVIVINGAKLMGQISSPMQSSSMHGLRFGDKIEFDNSAIFEIKP